MTHNRTELTSEDIALEIMREAGVQARVSPPSRVALWMRSPAYTAAVVSRRRLDWDRVTANAIPAQWCACSGSCASGYSSPEVLTPADAVLYDAAGDALALPRVAGGVGQPREDPA